MLAFVSVLVSACSNMESFVELDRLNMAPIIEAEGGTFDPAFRYARLISEIKAGAELNGVWENNRLVGYLEFHIVGDYSCKVRSIQIHPDYQNGVILAQLLGQFCKRLRRAPMLIVSSSVHEGNLKSLSLHQKLGFDEIKRESNRVFFEVNSYSLIERMKRFERRIS